MSVLSQFMNGGGKLRYQDFAASGTFTPSTQLLARGGQVLVFLVGGGGGGGGGQNNTSNGRGGGGGGGQVKCVPATVAAATTVTIGTGGAGGTYPASGSQGGTSSFGALSCVGGFGGAAAAGSATGGQIFIGQGGNSTSESGYVYGGGPGASNPATLPDYVGEGASTNGPPGTGAGTRSEERRGG